jgi:hypothetical protein
MSGRGEEELALLETVYPDLEHKLEGDVDWVRIPSYLVPGEAFKQKQVEVVFQIPPQAGAQPYGFWVRPTLETVKGTPISNYAFPEITPWGTNFGKLSWAPVEPWMPKTDIRAGSNMLNWARSFAERLREGA